MGGLLRGGLWRRDVDFRRNVLGDLLQELSVDFIAVFLVVFDDLVEGVDESHGAEPVVALIIPTIGEDCTR